MYSDKLVRTFYKVVFAYALFVCFLVYYYHTIPAPSKHTAGSSAGQQGAANEDLEDTWVNESKYRSELVNGNVNITTIHEDLEDTWVNESKYRSELVNGNNITTIPLFSDKDINPHPFNFTIANEDACFKNNEGGHIFLVVLVKCRPNEKYDRQQVRRTWGGVTQVLGRRALTMFLIGQTTDPTANQLLRNEDGTHHDFIQEDFIDSYHNMTYKNIMGLKWVTLFCPQASYVLSIDSDMTLNIVHLVRRLIRKPRVNFAEGHLRRDPLPHRHKSSKWYTPLEMYPEPTYAPFLNGACYVMSGDVGMAIYRESIHVRFLQWDDVFIGLVMKKIGIEPQLYMRYEQFLTIKSALKRGIASGIRHNINGVNEQNIEIWDEVVGKNLQD